MAAIEKRFVRLRIYNLAMGVFHAAQGAIIVALANDFSLPVTASFLEGPPGSGLSSAEVLFDVPLGWGVASFLFLSAIAHFTISLPGVFEWYTKNLKRERNYARWIEYSISSSVMVVLIAMLPGIYDIAALGAIFAVNATMVLFGLLMEHYETPGRPSWLSYFFGCLAGVVPWLLIGFYVWSPGSAADPPSFVYAIFVVLFIFFNTFALNMVLQYKKVGRWADYVYGESAYVLLSLVSKSILAWMVFANTLVPA